MGRRRRRYIRLWIDRQSLFIGSIYSWFWSFIGFVDNNKKYRMSPHLCSNITLNIFYVYMFTTSINVAKLF